MRPYEAYRQQQNASMPRIDLILALYRKALELLPRARQAIAEQRPDAAQKHIAQVQLIVTSLGSGYTADDEASTNFLRLYEFVSHRLTICSIADVQAAEQVLRT